MDRPAGRDHHDSGRVDLPVLLAAVDVPADEGLMGYMAALHDRITDRADHVRSEAEARQLRIAVLAVVVLASALGLTVLVSRSITRPLRSLTGQVKQMAERRLPDAVCDILEAPLGDDVRVPPIERQLDFITELEAKEADADALASLFKLDHPRNAGGPGPRRSGPGARR